MASTRQARRLETLAGLTLVAALGVGCAPAHRPAPPDEPAAAQVLEEYWPNGQLRLRRHALREADGSLVDHGTYERWYEDGVKEYEARFVHGKKEGTTIRYHRNGRKATQQEYRDGKRDGTSISWNPEGEKVKEENWTDGQPDGTWTVWEDGRVQWRHTFHHGAPAP